MREMLTVLRRKLGLIRPSGVLEIFPPDAEGWCTFGGPSLVLTEKGVEGPFWPDDLSWPVEVSRSGAKAAPVPPENATAPDKPELGAV